MADEKPKKTKIDLKARLKGAGGGGGGVATTSMPMPGMGGPPPMGEDGRPSSPSAVPSSNPIAAPVMPAARPSGGGGIAPPPGMSPGIPLPPFGPPARQAAAPKATAQAQTIKVEIGEEVEQERKKASKRTAVYAILAAMVGLGVGFVGGGSKEKGDRGKAAADGAAAIEKDVKAANDKLKELAEKLAAGQKDLGEKKFPADLATALGALNVPFDATNLEGKQVGSLNSKTLRPLLAYTSAVQEVNKQKDSLKNILGAAQAPITKAWKEEKEPPTNFAVVFARNGDKMYATFAPVKEPFPFGAREWPRDITVTMMENKKPAEKKATRWVKGDLTGSDPVAIPVEPNSVAGFSSDAMAGRLAKALFEVREVLEGKKDDPTHETAGLVKDGEDLANLLHQAANNR